MKPAKNPWPFAIILVFVLFISGTITLVVMACSQKVDLVSADYYEQEIKFQGHIDQLDRTHRLREDGSVSYDAGKRQIRIVLPRDAGATGHIQLYRPSASGLDRELKLETASNGIQSVDAAALKPGLWKVRVSWTAQSQEYFIEQSIKIAAPPSKVSADVTHVTM
jgi:hypothetical protein